MPTLGRPVFEGRLGVDYHLAMAIPFIKMALGNGSDFGLAEVVLFEIEYGEIFSFNMRI